MENGERGMENGERGMMVAAVFCGWELVEWGIGRVGKCSTTRPLCVLDDSWERLLAAIMALECVHIFRG
jgi:hypothetical protein